MQYFIMKQKEIFCKAAPQNISKVEIVVKYIVNNLLNALLHVVNLFNKITVRVCLECKEN